MPIEVVIATSADKVNGGGAVTLRVVTAADLVSHAWSAPRGRFSDPSADEPTWTAPEGGQDDQDVVLTVSVVDSHGAAAIARAVVVVRADEVPSSPWVRTVEGDVLDEVCWRHYGHERAVPAVLAANPGLAARSPVLPPGLIVALPKLSEPARRAPAVRLWNDP